MKFDFWLEMGPRQQYPMSQSHTLWSQEHFQESHNVPTDMSTALVCKPSHYNESTMFGADKEASGEQNSKHSLAKKMHRQPHMVDEE